MENEKIDQIRSKLFNSKLIHLPDNGGDCFETASVMRYVNSVEELVSEQKAEITEYRQRIEENVISIESMLHHNSVQKAEIERLREAGNELVKLIENHRKIGSEIKGIRMVQIIRNWNALIKKEGNNG